MVDQNSCYCFTHTYLWVSVAAPVFHEPRPKALEMKSRTLQINRTALITVMDQSHQYHYVTFPALGAGKSLNLPVVSGFAARTTQDIVLFLSSNHSPANKFSVPLNPSLLRISRIRTMGPINPAIPTGTVTMLPYCDRKIPSAISMIKKLKRKMDHMPTLNAVDIVRQDILVGATSVFPTTFHSVWPPPVGKHKEPE